MLEIINLNLEKGSFYIKTLEILVHGKLPSLSWWYIMDKHEEKQNNSPYLSKEKEGSKMGLDLVGLDHH